MSLYIIGDFMSIIPNDNSVSKYAGYSTDTYTFQKMLHFHHLFGQNHHQPHYELYQCM